MRLDLSCDDVVFRCAALKESAMARRRCSANARAPAGADFRAIATRASVACHIPCPARSIAAKFHPKVPWAVALRLSARFDDSELVALGHILSGCCIGIARSVY